MHGGLCINYIETIYNKYIYTINAKNYANVRSNIVYLLKLLYLCSKKKQKINGI